MNINYHDFAICSNTHVGSVDTNAGSDKAVHAVNHFHAPVIFPHKRLNNRQWEKLAHPDVHFVFPIVNNKKVSDDYLPLWRKMLMESTYTDLGHWMELIDAGNTQPLIYAPESDQTFRKLSLKSSQGGSRVVVVWLPERMNEACANKMLKLLEEPPERTAFLMVSEEPERLLPTIVSRTQRIYVPRIEEEDMVRVLTTRYGQTE